MNKLKSGIHLILISLSVSVYGKSRINNLNAGSYNDTITVVINHTNHKVRAFRYFDYYGELQVEAFPKNDTLEIKNKNGIVTYQGMGSQFIDAYCTLYPGDIIDLSITDGKELISSKNETLQAKIELMKKLYFIIQKSQHDTGNDIKNSLNLINNIYTEKQQLIESFKSKLDRRAFQEATAMSNFNNIDGIICAHLRHNIKNDTLFSLKIDTSFAWNYMAFGRLAYHYQDYIRKTYHIYSSVALVDFIYKNLPKSIGSYIVFNYLSTYNHGNKRQLDTLNKLTMGFAKNTTNKELATYLIGKLNSHIVSSKLGDTKDIMLIGANASKPMSLGQVVNRYKGKVIYLDFWASWCAPCLIQMPYSKILSRGVNSENKGVVFLYLSEDDNTSVWKNKSAELELPPERSLIFLKNKGLNDFFKLYAIKTIPRYMIINKEGKIINQDAARPGNAALKKLLNSLAGK